MNYDEITITKHETEFVAKHKDFEVIGVGSNEFEAVLELSKALGALMFSKEAEHEALKRDVARYFELQTLDRVAYHEEIKESFLLYVKLRKVGKKE